MEQRLPEPDRDLDLLAHRVIGAAIEVHRALGPGYLEPIYEQALIVELEHRGIPFERDKPITITYRGQTVGESRLALVVDRRLVVDVKAVDALLDLHQAQLTSSLRVGAFTLGLIFNFKARILKEGIRRVIWSPQPSRYGIVRE